MTICVPHSDIPLVSSLPYFYNVFVSISIARAILCRETGDCSSMKKVK